MSHFAFYCAIHCMVIADKENYINVLHNRPNCIPMYTAKDALKMIEYETQPESIKFWNKNGEYYFDWGASEQCRRISAEAQLQNLSWASHSFHLTPDEQACFDGEDDSFAGP